MTIKQFLSIVLSRKRLLIAVFFSVVALVTGISFLLSKHYVAQAMISIDAGNADPISSLSIAGQSSPQQNYLGTQASILSSHNTAKKVVQAMKLATSADIQARYFSATGAELAGIEDWLATILLKDLTVETGKDSNTISISFESLDPYFAAMVTNNFIEAYKKMVIEGKVGLASQNEAFFKTQIDELKLALEDKQKTLSDYQKEHGIIASTDDRIDLENQKMIALSAQVASAQSDYISARAQLNQSGRLTIETMTNPVIQQLTVQLAEQEKTLNELSQKEGPNHPAYRQAVIQIASTKSKLQELKKQYSDVQARTVDNMQKRWDDQQSELTLQKQKILDMKDKLTQLDILQRGIDNAQRNYNMVMQKWSESVMQANANLNNITVLQHAVPPIKPASPNIVFNVFISLFLGLFLGVTINYILDLLDRKIRCTDDIDLLFQVPILAQLNKKSDFGFRSRNGWRSLLTTVLAKGA